MPHPDLQRKVGQLFAVGFHGLTPSPEIKTLIHEYGLGAIVLFKRNVRDAAQLQALTHALQEEARLAGHEHPLFIGIDQENGLVTRICPPIAAQLPGPMALGATSSPDLAYEAGVVTGETLKHFGINMNYAPVCDINSEPLNPVIGVRSPGDDPEFVGRIASATAKGLREQKVVPSVKHFPGHGDTAVDSHYGLPVISKTRSELELCELVPFRRAAAEGVEAVMTAHISLPAIGDGQLPATLSTEVLNILRKDMRYDGMIITDCLEMDGIRATYGTANGAVMAIGAGSDSIMICHTYAVQVAAIQQVCEEVESGIIPISRINQAYDRVTALKRKFLSWETVLAQRTPGDLSSLNQSGSVLAKNAYARSVTLVRDIPGVIPLPKSSKIAFLFPGDQTPTGGAVDGEGLGRKGSYSASPYLEALKRHNPNVVEIRYGEKGLSATQFGDVETADAVVFVSINARESPYQRSLGLELPKRAKKLVSLAACAPYDFLEDNSIQTYITTYEPTIEAFTAAADVIFGEAPARGVLPVRQSNTVQSHIKVRLYDAPRDLDHVAIVWNASLPSYALDKEHLGGLLEHRSSYHFVAEVEDKLVGFCIIYTDEPKPGLRLAYLAALAVSPGHQNQGIGTKLIAETRASLQQKFEKYHFVLHSSFPRFWPGIPTDLPAVVQEFFVHRGFRLKPLVPRAVDLYQDIKGFQAPEKYLTRAAEKQYTFSPLQPEQYAGCIAGQKKNFSDNTYWVNMFHQLNPTEYPDSIMTAFNSEGRQIAWTLMLAPSSPILRQNWAMPPLCGPKTGLIGCVGVDAEYRGGGVGLALLCHAIENLKTRGVEGVFVDWVELDGWYEQLGFAVWRQYRGGMR